MHCCYVTYRTIRNWPAICQTDGSDSADGAASRRPQSSAEAWIGRRNASSRSSCGRPSTQPWRPSGADYDNRSATVTWSVRMWNGATTTPPFRRPGAYAAAARRLSCRRRRLQPRQAWGAMCTAVDSGQNGSGRAKRFRCYVGAGNGEWRRTKANRNARECRLVTGNAKLLRHGARRPPQERTAYVEMDARRDDVIAQRRQRYCAWRWCRRQAVTSSHANYAEREPSRGA